MRACAILRIVAGRQRSSSSSTSPPRAVRVVVSGHVQGVGFREAVRRRARPAGVHGWVRNEPDGTVSVHAEGAEQAVAELVEFLGKGPRGASVEDIQVRDVKAEGHEQFAVRGVSAGVFVVQEHQASTHHFDLRLEVDGAMRSWAVPKGPSLDSAVKRLAVQVEDHSLGYNDFEGTSGYGPVSIWDRGRYEQGGRVPWPEALDRGHAVFVLHGQKLTGGFALQRTGSGAKAQWLLIKRRDEQARPGSDVVAEQPQSVNSGRTLAEIDGSPPST
jgi:DNA ligase D-like protein (predicted 3'-phosphoesterase)